MERIGSELTAKLVLIRVIVVGDACKPNSVFLLKQQGGSYLSGIGVATNLKQPTRARLPDRVRQTNSLPTQMFPDLLGLAPCGVCRSD